MSLEAKIKKLIEQSAMDEMNEVADYDSMSDAELMAACEQEGMEDMLVRDEEGGLANREECIAALDTLELSQEESVAISEDIPPDLEVGCIVKMGGEKYEIIRFDPDAGKGDLKHVETGKVVKGVYDNQMRLVSNPNQYESVVLEAEEDEEPVEGEEELTDEEPVDELDVEDDLPADEGDESESGDELDAEEEESEVTVVIVSPELQDEEDEEEELLAQAEKDVRDEHFAMLMNGEDLSEDFKTKAGAIFAAAVKESVAVYRTKLQEKFDRLSKKVKATSAKQIAESKAANLEEMAEIVDGYLTEGIQSWVEENAIAVTQNVRAEIAEEFIDGLKTLFVEHYVEIPEEKFDLVKAQEEKIAELTEQKNRLAKEKAKALAESAELKFNVIIEKSVDGLTELDKNRFMRIAENLEFKNASELEKKIGLLRESFDRKRTSKPTRQPVTESVAQVKEKAVENSTIDKYVQAISRSVSQ